METIFDVVILLSLTCNIYYLFSSIKSVREIHIQILEIRKHIRIVSEKNICDANLLKEKLDEIKQVGLKTDKLSEQIFSIICYFDRMMLDFRDSLNTAKPIKPNNWDSVREVFKGPVKHERD